MRALSLSQPTFPPLQKATPLQAESEALGPPASGNDRSGALRTGPVPCSSDPMLTFPRHDIDVASKFRVVRSRSDVSNGPIYQYRPCQRRSQTQLTKSHGSVRRHNENNLLPLFDPREHLLKYLIHRLPTSRTVLPGFEAFRQFPSPRS